MYSRVRAYYLLAAYSRDSEDLGWANLEQLLVVGSFTLRSDDPTLDASWL
jgi:hypothetical protein